MKVESKLNLAIDTLQHVRLHIAYRIAEYPSDRLPNEEVKYLKKLDNFIQERFSLMEEPSDN